MKKILNWIALNFHSVKYHLLGGKYDGVSQCLKCQLRATRKQ